MPVGSVYVRFKGQPAPNTLWGGTWQNISSQYAGEFFRAEGGDAPPFGQSQAEGLPNITGQIYPSDVYGLSAGENINGEGCFNVFQQNRGISFNTTGLTWKFNFDASRSSDIYGKSNHNTPKNSTVQIWKRIS